MIYKATSDPDSMYMHQAMKQIYTQKFRKAIKKEWGDHIKIDNLSVIKRTDVTEVSTVLSSVCQMKITRYIHSIIIKKYKTKLNIYGSRMRNSQHYE